MNTGYEIKKSILIRSHEMHTHDQQRPHGARTTPSSNGKTENRSGRGKLLKLSVLAMAVITAQDALAQQAPAGGIDEVLVIRSRNRLESQQDVPISVSVVRGEEIDQLLANDINSLVLRTANITWNQGNQRTSSLSIRGIGKQAQTEAQDPSVGVIVDGISYAYNALTNSFDFYDVETVEVVRGPQGTLLGKNASVGVVNITTRRPSFEDSADFQLSIGERDTLIGRAALGGAVIDDLLAWRGSFTVQKAEGYLVNRFNPDVTYQNKDRVSGRIQLLFTPTPDLSVRAQITKTPRAGETTNGRTINVPRPSTYANGAPNNSLDDQQRLSRPYFTQRGSYTLDGNYYYGGSGDPNHHGNWVENEAARGLHTGGNGGILEANWDNVGPFSLTSITGYQDYHFNAMNDEGTPWTISLNSGGYWNDYRQASQEFRITSDLGGFVDYQAGLYFLRVHNVAQYNQFYGPDAGAWFASNAQYQRLDVPVNPDGSVSGGPALLRNSAAGLKVATGGNAGWQDILNKSNAVFAQANWHFTDNLTLTTGIRFTREDRRSLSRGLILDNGDGYELNPVEIRGVQLGGFASHSATGALLPGNSLEQLQLADLVAKKYFGVQPTDVPGAAYGSLTEAQLRQVADAKAIRQARIGVVHPLIEAEPFKETQPAFVISPTWHLNDDINLYFAWQYGEKAGISQSRAGESYNVAGEKNDAYEIGIKSVLFDGSLVFNADYYWADIKNYQQGVRVVDEYQTALNIAAGVEPATAYLTLTGNVPKVRAQGIEIDGIYSPSFLPNTRIRFALAWTDAYYKDFPNAALAAENNWPGANPYADYSGKTLPGVAKYSGNIGIEWSKPLADGRKIFINANAAYSDKYNSDNSLSEYGWIPARTLVDASFGYGTAGGNYTVSLIAKNLFDDDTPLSRSWSSYIPPEPQWLGIMVQGSF
jgi:Outer membrane receptor for ferrienterochelin and colicins